VSEGDRFAMETWHDAGWTNGTTGRPYETAGWTRMDRFKGGAAGWRPHPTAAAAVRKCLTWTGLTGIPTMRVVDLLDGERVVWQFGHDDQAGPNINHMAWWFQAARASARADLAGEPAPPVERPPPPGQEALW
jgi:hypothetical protein